MRVTTQKPSVPTVDETAVGGFTFSETLVSVKVHNGASHGVTEDPFGGLISATGTESTNNHFRFSTKYFDEETGLYYYGFRYYSPGLGRWMSRDPIEEEDAINLYAFVENDPILYYDVDGRRRGSGPSGASSTAQGANNACGPDVTASLSKTLDEVTDAYEKSWTLREKCSACSRIFTKSEDAWDIVPLYRVGKGTLASKVLSTSGGSVSDGTGPDCEYTVTYRGRCYHASLLNYILWGRMNYLCSGSAFLPGVGRAIGRMSPLNPWSLQTAQALATGRKFMMKTRDPSIIRQMNSCIAAGYSGSNTRVPANSLRNCSMRSGNAVQVQSMTWVWEPNQPR